MENAPENNSLVVSFLNLRKWIGIFGLALPIAILVYAFGISLCAGLEDSISAYYHTRMQDIFVAILCAVGVFMMAYKGYERRDTIASFLAGTFAIAVAMFPTDEVAACGGTGSTPAFIGAIHYMAAAGLFFSFAYMSLWLFTRSGGNITPRKMIRNRVYRSCGWIILSCIAMMLLHKFTADLWPKDLKPVFWLETIALFAFGASWLVKGETLLKDKPGPSIDTTRSGPATAA